MRREGDGRYWLQTKLQLQHFPNRMKIQNSSIIVVPVLSARSQQHSWLCGKKLEHQDWRNLIFPALLIVCVQSPKCFSHSLLFLRDFIGKILHFEFKLTVLFQVGTVFPEPLIPRYYCKKRMEFCPSELQESRLYSRISQFPSWFRFNKDTLMLIMIFLSLFSCNINFCGSGFFWFGVLLFAYAFLLGDVSHLYVFLSLGLSVIPSL